MRTCDEEVRPTTDPRSDARVLLRRAISLDVSRACRSRQASDEVELLMRRDRAGCWITMDEILFFETCAFEIWCEKERWASGRVVRTVEMDDGVESGRRGAISSTNASICRLSSSNENESSASESMTTSARRSPPYGWALELDASVPALVASAGVSFFGDEKKQNAAAQTPSSPAVPVLGLELCLVGTCAGEHLAMTRECELQAWKVASPRSFAPRPAMCVISEEMSSSESWSEDDSGGDDEPHGGGPPPRGEDARANAARPETTRSGRTPTRARTTTTRAPPAETRRRRRRRRRRGLRPVEEPRGGVRQGGGASERAQAVRGPDARVATTRGARGDSRRLGRAVRRRAHVVQRGHSRRRRDGARRVPGPRARRRHTGQRVPVQPRSAQRRAAGAEVAVREILLTLFGRDETREARRDARRVCFRAARRASEDSARDGTRRDLKVILRSVTNARKRTRPYCVYPSCTSSCTSHFCVAMSSLRHAVKLGSLSWSGKHCRKHSHARGLSDSRR